MLLFQFIPATILSPYHFPFNAIFHVFICLNLPKEISREIKSSHAGYLVYTSLIRSLFFITWSNTHLLVAYQCNFTRGQFCTSIYYKPSKVFNKIWKNKPLTHSLLHWINNRIIIYFSFKICFQNLGETPIFPAIWKLGAIQIFVTPNCEVMYEISFGCVIYDFELRYAHFQSMWSCHFPYTASL